MNSFFKYSTYFDNKQISQVNANPPQYLKAHFFSQWATCPYASSPSQTIMTNTYFDPSLPYQFQSKNHSHHFS